MTYQATVLANNPVLFFQFDEQSGDTVLDYSTRTPAGHMRWQGGTDYLQKQPRITRDIPYSSATVTNSAPVSQSLLTRFPNSEWSVETWFRIEDTTDQDITLFDFRSPGGDIELRIQIRGDRNDFRIRMTLNNNTVDFGPYFPRLLTDVLRQLVVTYAEGGSTLLKFYVDGVLVDTNNIGTLTLESAGFASVMGAQSSMGVLDTGSIKAGGIGAVAVYPIGLDQAAIDALNLAGDAYPLVEFRTSSPLPIQDYVNVLIDYGENRVAQGASLSCVYEGGESEAICDIGLTSGLGFFPKWEGSINPGGSNTIQINARRDDFTHQRDKLVFYCSASNDRNVTVDLSDEYTICGTEKYPEDMDPFYETIVDSQGCPVDC